MDAAHLARLARWRESRRESNRLTFALLDRRRALGFPAAIEADAMERLLRREAELGAMRAGTVAVRLPALEALADFVAEFAVEAEARLPAPWGPRIADEIHAVAFGVLHDDPTSPLDAVAAMVADEGADERARRDLAAALEVAEAEHRVLTDALRRAERRRMSIGPRMIAGDEALRGEFDVLARRIGELVTRRQAVHDALRSRARELVGPAGLARHLWPPPRDPLVQAWIVQGRETAARRQAAGAG